MHPLKLACAVLIVTFSLNISALAEEDYIRSGMWGGIDAGVGFLKQSFDEGDDENDTAFFLGFEVGYTINPHFLIGLELSGWLLEASDLEDPSGGEGISQVFLISRYYPSQELGLFGKVGGGYVSSWNNRSGESRKKNGWGLTLGGGCDFLLNENVALSPFLTFNYGETGNREHRAINLGLGITLQ